MLQKNVILQIGSEKLVTYKSIVVEVLLSKNTKIRVYRNIIWPVVFYGCGTWSLTLTEEQRLRVFENRVLRRIFGSKRDEATGEWGRLHNEELNDLYPSPNIITVIKSRKMKWAGHVACVEEKRGAYRILVGRSDRRRPRGRPMGRWEDNIKMDLQKVYGAWTGLSWLRIGTSGGLF
jgi:hypothetical protein